MVQVLVKEESEGEEMSEETVLLVDFLVKKEIITKQDRENILYGKYARDLKQPNEGDTQ